jgi:predicted Zn-dependent protease
LLYAAGKSREAVPHMRKGRQLFSGDAPMMDVNLAQALLATQDPASLDEAINLLRKATIVDDDNSQAFHLLANAYYKKSLSPQATLAAAQGHFSDGNFKQAKIFAKRAQAGLKQGTPEWIKAEDIITFKIPEEG